MSATRGHRKISFGPSEPMGLPDVYIFKSVLMGLPDVHIFKSVLVQGWVVARRTQEGICVFSLCLRG